MFASRIFVFFTLTVVFSCISSIHGWLFYKKSYYPYATREYNGNHATNQHQNQNQQQNQAVHHPAAATPNSNWVPMLHSGVFYNDANPGQGVPVTVALPVAIPATVLKDNVPANMYMNSPHGGSVQSVPLYIPQSDRPQGFQAPQGYSAAQQNPSQLQDSGMKYTYGPCMCPVSYTTKVEADPTPSEQPTHTQPATPTRETYVVQPAGTTTA